MTAKKIILKTPIRSVQIPNCWENLTPDQFTHLVSLLSLFAAGLATAEDVKFLFICNALNIDPKRIKKTDVMSNLVVLAEKVTFIFNKKGKPEPIFAAQLIPKLNRNKGYTISTNFNTLTSSLTAQQFIDAHDVLKSGGSKLPLLTSILYFKGIYKSGLAHQRAIEFTKIKPAVLQAVAVNFQAFVAFLFQRTHFSILQSKQSVSGEIGTGLNETLYNLCADGLGNIEEMKQIPLIEFLSILRKKLIESVQAMHAAKISIAEIALKTGLHSRTIKKIL